MQSLLSSACCLAIFARPSLGLRLLILLCGIDLLAVTFAKHGVNIFLAYLLATVLYFIVTIPLTFYIMSSNNL